MNPKKKITLTDEQSAAIKLMESGANVFLTGKAGTGKSTVLREFRNRNQKSTLYVAPTGIAAVNIEGQTIHSCFQIKPGMMSDLEPLSSKRRYRILKNTEVIVIDEISMVRSDLLAAVDARMRQISNGLDHDKPFGGRQVIVVGDFFQLPPVIDTATLYSYLCMRYGGVYAFQTAAWSDAEFTTVNLTKVLRQTDDEFIQILNGIRVGSVDSLDDIRHKVGAELPHNSITISPYRATVDAINAQELDKLEGQTVVFHGKVNGKFTKDLPVDQELKLKVGARVMLAANRYNSDGSMVFTNGELGEVVAIGNDSVTVRRDNNTEVTVGVYEWEMYEFDYSGVKVESTKVGSYTQLPVRLAWAVTIHKSQGCTFDNMLLELGRGCFAEGQLYTALSRVKSLEGLSLSRELRNTDLRVSDDIIKFYDNL